MTGFFKPLMPIEITVMSKVNPDVINTINTLVARQGLPSDIIATITAIKQANSNNDPINTALAIDSAIIAAYKSYDNWKSIIELAKGIPNAGGILIDTADLGLILGQMATDGYNNQTIKIEDILSALSTVASISSSLALTTALAASSPVWASVAVAFTATGVALSYAAILSNDQSIDIAPYLQTLYNFNQQAINTYDAAYEEFQQNLLWADQSLESVIIDMTQSSQDISHYADHIAAVLAEGIAKGYYGREKFFNTFFDSVGDWYRNFSDEFRAAIKNAAIVRLIDPIVVDMDGDGIELIARTASNVFFDMSGNGQTEWTGWVAKDDAFLVTDINGNNTIDSINELIGKQNESGFTALLAYDSNNDKALNNSDSQWTQLKLWQDTNTNGLTEAGELITLAEAGIKSFDLRYHTVNFTAQGNQIHESSIFERTDGSTGTVVDAWLDVHNVVRAVGNINSINTLPFIRAYGDVADLHTAMLNDGALTSLVNSLALLQVDQLNNVRLQVEHIIYRWAGTHDIAINSRGANFDGRILATLEKFMGTPYKVNNITNPNTQAVANLTNAWTELVNGVQSRLLSESVFKTIIPTSIYDIGADRYIILGSIDDIISDFKSAQPTADSVNTASYWGAVIPIINQLAEDTGIDSHSAAHRSKIATVLAELGLNKFQDGLLTGINNATMTGNLLNQNGLFTLTENADDVQLNNNAQAVYALGGDDSVVVTNNDANSAMVIDGGAGDDYLQGGKTADWLNGGTGIDILIGLNGDDTYSLDNNDDSIIEYANNGIDTVRSSISYSLANNIENLNLLGADDLQAIGNQLNNSLLGNSGNNRLIGNAGNDSLNGLIGADSLSGGAGNDVYTINSVDDVISEGFNAGTDSVLSTISYNLINYLENLQLQGIANNNATGNALNNNLIGNSGDNRLDGGEGADTLSGQSGNDTYIIDHSNDKITEAVNAGIDSVNSRISYTLVDNVEHLLLTGTNDINATGNALANYLTGNAGANSLEGKAGTDTLSGNDGDDTYIIDDNNDRIIEQPNQGYDQVISSISYSLSDTIEQVVLTGKNNSNATGNAFDNSLIGNQGANLLSANEGDDSLYGEAGNDTLQGSVGDDTLDGGQGVDSLIGGSGNDSYIIDNVADSISPELNDTGVDSIYSSVGWILANNFEHLILTGTAAIDANGNELNNRLIGNDANNVLDGKSGADTLIGWAGNDSYIIDDSNDKVLEYPNNGTDTVRSSVNYVLGNHLEQVILQGTANLKAVGNSLNNSLLGNNGTNLLIANAGDDSLDGGAGIDTLIGGTGNDVYWLDQSDETITELSNEGIDTVFSTVSYSLSAEIENLQLQGTNAINAIGNELKNTLTGNNANNSLDGGLGIDTLSGGLGDDTYSVNQTGDKVTEAKNAGIDTVISEISYTLADTLENLTLSGSSAINATGNTSANVLIGNAGANSLEAGPGADTMIGQAGDDNYSIDNSADRAVEMIAAGFDSVISSINYSLPDNIEQLTLAGNANLQGTGNLLNNVLIGNTGTNNLKGNEGNDILDGKAGIDTLIGGTGDDSYTVDNSSDSIIENNDEGIDTVYSSISWILANYFEQLVLIGTNNIDANGNEFNNTLTGNAKNNVLDGKAGIDTLIGADGNDTYLVDNSEDSIIELVNNGIDAVRSSVDYSLTAEIENLVLLGTTNNKATGNALNNSLSGNNGANVISGNAGDDSINGGLANDTLEGGAGKDVFILDTAANSDTVTDFTATDDTLQLDNAIFTALGANGTVAASRFHVGTFAVDKDDYIIYDYATGSLFYDADGNGISAIIKIATLGTNLVLTNSDFVVI